MEIEKKATEEKFDSAFHKKYVGGVGVVDDKNGDRVHHLDRPMTDEFSYDLYERVLSEYRWYIKDKTADLPEEVKEDLKKIGIVKHDRKD